jgi:membrane-bound lytic murein transglycosylase A
MKKIKSIYIVLIAVVILAAAVYFLFQVLRKPVEWTPENSLFPVSAPDIADRGDAESLIRAIDQSLRYFEKLAQKEQSPEILFSFGKEKVSLEQAKESLLDFKARLQDYGLTETFFRYVKQNYRFYRSAAKRVLFTGYFEADLRGSLTPSGVYRYPLYRKPDDLYRVDLSQFSFYRDFKGLPRVLRGRLSVNRTIIPYYTREEIDYQGKLAGQGLEIAWIDDPIDVFFLHIQGSGIIQLDTGETLRISYEESNGHPYRAIGGLLVRQNILSYENMSMQSIRAYLEAHPEQVRDIFCYNPGYVFFRVVDEGPLGSLDVPVTAYRSIATDRYLFPEGALCYIETLLPVFNEEKQVVRWERYERFVLNQDTGGAIRTPARVDLFTGYGEKSRLVAGHLKAQGTFYFLTEKKNPTSYSRIDEQEVGSPVRVPAR